MTTDDMDLVGEYARHHSQEAFAALVSRYVNLVFSVALHQLRDASLAEEVTQAVFIILARKAGSLGPKTILSAWLCRTAQYAAANVAKAERRRKYREQETYMQSLLNQPEPETSPWSDIAPLLNTAMAELDGKDHSAIVLRFFEGKNLKQVGVALGVNENTAATRVSRAVEKMRKFFVKRGITMSSAVIVQAISANAVQAAPAALAKSVSAIATSKGAAASTSTLTLIKGTLKFMAWTNMKTGVVIGVCTLLTGTAVLTAINVTDHSIRTMPSDWVPFAGAVDAWHWSHGKITVHDDFGDGVLVSGKEYGDFKLSANVTASSREASFALRMRDPDHGYFLTFVPAGTAWTKHNSPHLDLIKISRGQVDDGKILAVFKGRKLSRIGPHAKIEVVARGPLIEVRLNNIKVLEVRDDSFLTGRVGLRVAGDPPGPSDAVYSKLIIQAIGDRSNL